MNEATAAVETRSYDINGNMVKASTSCCQQTSYNYTAATKYAYPESQIRGSATDGLAQVTTSATYDFNTGLVLSAKDANGRTSQTSYFPTAAPANGQSAKRSSQRLRLRRHGHECEPNYLPGGLIRITRQIADQNVKLLNGRGEVRQQQALGANGVWDFVDVTYDHLGRVHSTKQTLSQRRDTAMDRD